MTTSQKAKTVTTLRSQYPLQALLKVIRLPRATYYDRLKRDAKPDKYADVKAFIKPLFVNSHETYGYRRICSETKRAGSPYAEETIRKIMAQMGLKVTVYSRHSSRYNSYKGHVGKVADNLLNQVFNATVPYTVLHTDVTQVRLAGDNQWAYISPVLDEASREIIAYSISEHPNRAMVRSMLNQLATVLPQGADPILHSDQGWQYQQTDYQNRLKEMDITQSMSRKGNCHDNAPIESFFNLLKRESLNRQKITTLTDLKQAVEDYVTWYNQDRISMNKNGLSPVEYRERALAA